MSSHGQPRQREMDFPKIVKRIGQIRLYGKISAILFVFTFIAILDGLQSLARHDFNSFDLIPGEKTFITGALPADAEDHSDIEIILQNGDGVKVTPIDSFKGFWMGGQMWRAEVEVDPYRTAGEAYLTVVDLIQAKRRVEDPDKLDKIKRHEGISPDAEELKHDQGIGSYGTGEASMNFSDEREDMPMVQNPTLVYTLKIWSDAESAKKAHTSFFYRATGLSSFKIAGCSIFFALIFGIAGWRAFARAEEEFSRDNTFIVHGVKAPGSHTPTGFKSDSWQALCAYSSESSIFAGDSVKLYDNKANFQGKGFVREMDSSRFVAEFPATNIAPVYGWVLIRSSSSTK